MPEAGKKPNFRKNKKAKINTNQYNITLNPKTHNRVASGATQVGVIGEIGAPTLKQPY